MAAIMDGSVSFGRVEVVKRPEERLVAHPHDAWLQPRKPVKAARRPEPTAVTMGDYLRPSAFVRAARLEEAAAMNQHVLATSAVEKDLVIGAPDSDTDDWVEGFERRYNDVVRIAPKEKNMQ